MTWERGDVIGLVGLFLTAFLAFAAIAKSRWRRVWLFVAIGILAVGTCVICTPDIRGLLNEDTIADIRADEAKADRQLADLKTKGPPYFYRTSGGCPDTWVNIGGQRVLVVGPQSVNGSSTIPVEPLGSLISQDKDHFYDGEKVVSVNSEQEAANCFPPVEVRVAASPRLARVGEPVHFQAFASGGDTYFAFNWEDDEGKNLANRIAFDHSFKTAGIKKIRATAFSNGTSRSETASVLVRP